MRLVEVWAADVSVKQHGHLPHRPPQFSTGEPVGSLRGVRALAAAHVPSVHSCQADAPGHQQWLHFLHVN